MLFLEQIFIEQLLSAVNLPGLRGNLTDQRVFEE